MITQEQYQEIRARLQLHEQWIDTIRTKRKCRKCHGKPYRTGTGRNFATLAEATEYCNVYTSTTNVVLGIEACERCDGRGHILGWASYKPEDKPANVPDVSNDERAQVELYEFITNPPERYFLYIKHANTDTYTGERGEATGFTGEHFGAVTFGTKFRASFGDTRVPVTVRAVNGRTYTGIYYKSAGSYARVKLSRGSAK